MARLLRRITALAALVLGGEFLYVRLRSTPWFDGLDPSGRLGDSSKPPFRLLVLGDSTATAPGLDDPDHSWPRIVAGRLTDRYQVELVCLAEGGARSADVLQIQLPQAERSRWDLAIVSVGSNDVLHLVPVWRFAKNLDEIVRRLVEVCDAVVLFGVGDLSSIPLVPYPLDRLAWVAGHIADRVHGWVGRRRGVAKVDQWLLTTAPFNSGADMFSPDLFHPSRVGHQAWADSVIPTVQSAVAHLEQSRPPQEK